MTQAQCCPVCGGNGIKDAGFYRSTTGSWISSRVQLVTCRSCEGKGYIVIPDTPAPTYQFQRTTNPGVRIRVGDPYVESASVRVDAEQVVDALSRELELQRRGYGA